MNANHRNAKGLIGFLTFLVTVCMALGVLAEAGTIFPWLAYTLDVALVTADPELVDVQNAPEGGALVLVKLVSLSGGIKTEDIQENYPKIIFRDGNGDEFTTDSLRFRGVAFDQATGLFSTKPEQDAFELLFFLKGKDESALEGAKLVVPDSVEGQRILVPLDKAPHETATSEQSEETASGASSFLLSGVRYTVSALEDEPKFQIPNRMDGKEGHVVAFSYPGHDSDAKDANKLLYSGARLRQPNGDVVKPYSNSDNIGNPYELYFGLPDDVLLTDCVFTITGDEGDVEIPLSSIGGEGTNTANEPQPTPIVTAEPSPAPTEEPASEQTEEPKAERDENAFAYTVGGQTYELALMNVAYDKEEKAMAVEIVLYDHELLDFIWDKELHMPFGCGIISQKDGFQYVEGVTATVSTPMHMTFFFNTKTLPDLVCFGKLNEEEHAASEDFALVDPESNQFISTFPLSALLENEKKPDAILESVDAASDEPKETQTPAETIAPAASENASEIERQILAVLAQCAEGTADKWQLAIYNAGIQDAAADAEKEGVYTFKLRGFDPGLKALGKFGPDNRETYVSSLLENARAYGLEASLTINNGEFTSKSVKTLQSVVKKAAAASQNAFKDKRILSAFAYELLYDSFGSKVKKAEEIVLPTDALVSWQIRHLNALERLSAQQWTAFFFGQTKQSLDVSGGPFAMKLNCTSIDFAQLMESAKAEALDALRYLDYDTRWANDQVEYQYLLALAEQAIAMKTKGKEPHTISINVDGDPFYGAEYAAYLETFAYEDGLSALENEVSLLPDYAAKEFPDTGWMSGSKSGTQVRIKAPKDSDAYYVQLRGYHNDEIAVSGFVCPGKTCTLRVPKGDYYFVMASGSTWYGEKLLFGDDTSFSKTGLFEVMGSNYYHTVTLKVTEGGNMPLYDADEDDLL